MTKERKHLLISLENLSEDKKKKINAWVDAQANYKNSILKLIEHSIYRFGNCDITDYEIEKKLHTEILVFSQDGEFFPEFVINPKISISDSSGHKVNQDEKSDENKTTSHEDETVDSTLTDQKKTNRQNKTKNENEIDYSGLDLENF